MDQLGGVFADHAHAQQLLVGAGENQLEHAGSVAGDVPAGVVFVEGAAHAVVNLLFFAGFFGLAGGGNLRNGVDAHGQHGSDPLLIFEAKGMANGDAALLHRS